MKGRSGYTFDQIAVYAFTPMVTLEGIFLWTNHPYHEAQGLVRKRVGHWTILRAVATPVPESKSNPIQSISITKTSYFIAAPYMSSERSVHCAVDTDGNG